MGKVICEGQCEEALLHSRGICNSKPNRTELAQVVERRIGKINSQGCANMAGEFAMAGLWSEQPFSMGEGGARGAWHSISPTPFGQFGPLDLWAFGHVQITLWFLEALLIRRAL